MGDGAAPSPPSCALSMTAQWLLPERAAKALLPIHFTSTANRSSFWGLAPRTPSLVARGAPVVG